VRRVALGGDLNDLDKRLIREFVGTFSPTAAPLRHERDPRCLGLRFHGRTRFRGFGLSRVVHLAMERRSLYTLLIGLMTVLNGTVMLLGPGLNTLPGFGHHAVATRGLRVDDGLEVASGIDSALTWPIREYLARGNAVAEKVYVVISNSSSPSIPALPSRYGCS
jgi:hypothetical protein